MTQTSADSSNDAGRWATRILLALIAVLMLGYALQVPGPTRMMDDTVSYFLRAHQLLDGQGLEAGNPLVRHPIGYSIVLAGMIRMGMDSTWWFIALNVVCLGMALVLLVPIYRAAFSLSNFAIAACITFFLLSWTVVKHVPMLYSELLYTAMSLSILWLLSCAQPKRIWLRAGVFVLALALTAALIQVRTIGLVMLPVLLWYLVQQVGGWGAVYGRATRDGLSKAVTAGLVLLFASGFVYKVATYDLDTGSRYVSMMFYSWTERPAQTAVQVIDHRLLEFGKLTVNAPERAMQMVSSKLGLSSLVWQVPLYAAGCLAIGLLFAGLWQQRRRLSLVHVYLLGFLALQLPWLSYDARFWLPVIPLMLPVMIQPLMKLRAKHPILIRNTLAGYALCYGVIGLGAMGLGLSHTYAGRDYAPNDIWFSGELMVAYGLADPDAFSDLDMDAVNLIRRYDPLTPEHLRLTGVPEPMPVPTELSTDGDEP